MKVLAVSDLVVDALYSEASSERDPDIDAIISCGDLPYYYLDYLSSRFNSTVFYVRGNHANFIETPSGALQLAKLCGVNMHTRVERFQEHTLAGVEGCIRYNRGRFQYTQSEMWFHVFRLVPRLMTNRMRFGNFLDIFISHTPPWQINDQTDPAHQGSKAFRWLIEVFKPTYHFHGHVHLYTPATKRETDYHQTRVINTYGYRYLEIS